MSKLLILILIVIFNFNTFSYGKNSDCKDLKKFSVEYLKCKGKSIKDKTVSTGKNIIKDTKDYQNNEWSKEKDKIKKAKEKVF